MSGQRFVLASCFSLIACVSAWSRGPLLLEANLGQFPGYIQYVARSANVSTAVTPDGLTFRTREDEISLSYVRAGAPHCEPNSAVASEANYLNINPAITHVPEYSSVLCRNLYPGVDWLVRTSGNNIEHDWIIAPRSNASAVAMELQNGASATVTANGDLLIHKGELTILWKKPLAWQQAGAIRREVPVAYTVRGQRISLRIGAYRRDLPLTIDPAIDFSYVFGGGTSSLACKVGLDGAGNIYVAGITLPGFQITSGAAISSPTSSGSSSSYQAFVQELSPDGSTVVYSTYVGSASVPVLITLLDNPIGMRVDAAGNVYLAAFINEGALPVTGNQIDPQYGLTGRVGVYKIAPGGSRLIYATAVYSVGYAALAIDSAGFAYITGGKAPLYLSKLDPTGSTEVINFTGVSGQNFMPVTDVAVGPDGSLYVAGTISTNKLFVTPGAMTAVPPDLASHGYLMRLKADGSGPIYSTYIAGGVQDGVYALTVDASGNAYVGGYTYYTVENVNGTTISVPGIQGTLLGVPSPPPNISSAFVMKVNPQGSVAIFTALVPGSSVSAIALDGAGNVYTAGEFTVGGGQL